MSALLNGAEAEQDMTYQTPLRWQCTSLQVGLIIRHQC